MEIQRPRGVKWGRFYRALSLGEVYDATFRQGVGIPRNFPRNFVRDIPRNFPGMCDNMLLAVTRTNLICPKRPIPRLIPFFFLHDLGDECDPTRSWGATLLAHAMCQHHLETVPVVPVPVGTSDIESSTYFEAPLVPLRGKSNR